MNVNFDKSEPLERIVELSAVGLSLSSRAGSVEILRGIDLNVSAGESAAIIGPSGSGKTSLLMIIAGLEKATTGSVRVAGADLATLSENQRARLRGRNIGIVFQSFHLVPTLNALENAALPLELAGDRQAFAKAESALIDVGLAHRLKHFPAELSGGEQQRVAIARAVTPEPRLLLADEPTGNLDGKTGTQVMDLLFALHVRRQMALLLITHDATLARRTGRVIELADGRIVKDSQPGLIR